ncbi:MAG: hypothetical protein U0R69_06635 [Gaiellales bacterium]
MSPISSLPATSTPREAALGGDPLDDLVRRRPLPVLEVHAHLDEPLARQLEPERAHGGQPPVPLADQAGDLARDLDVTAAQVDIERDERLANADEHAAGRRVEPGRPSIRRELPRVDPPLQLLRPAATKEGRAPCLLAQAAVQEDGQLELAGEAVGEGERRRPRPWLVLRPDRDERDDVGGADPRMDALVGTEVDALDRDPDPREQRLDELLARPDEREHRAVVILVAVDVEQPRGAGEHLAKRLERCGIASDREVRDGLERKRHGRMPTLSCSSRAPPHRLPLARLARARLPGLRRLP